MTRNVRPEFSTLFLDFERYFEVSLARTEEQKRAVYRVRYNVYCETLGFEDAEAFEDGLETDAFDPHSIQCLVTHRATGRPAGCVRLVTVDADTNMPLEEHCAGALDSAILRQTLNRRGHVAEVSRLAVDSPFCRLRGNGGGRGVDTVVSQFSAAEQRTFPLIAVTLFLAAGAAADLLRRTDCFALMEPSLEVMLKRKGIATQRVGRDIEYRGTRAPYYLDIDEAVRALPNGLRLYYERVREQIAQTMSLAGARELSDGGEAGSDNCQLPMDLNLGLA